MISSDAQSVRLDIAVWWMFMQMNPSADVAGSVDTKWGGMKSGARRQIDDDLRDRPTRFKCQLFVSYRVTKLGFLYFSEFCAHELVETHAAHRRHLRLSSQSQSSDRLMKIRANVSSWGSLEIYAVEGEFDSLTNELHQSWQRWLRGNTLELNCVPNWFIHIAMTTDTSNW